MPRTKEQFEELRSRKIDLIESTAMECFAEKGFHGTSIGFIAKRAGISTGLTYNYFPSKEDLLTSIYMKGIKKIFEPIEKLGTIGKTEFNNFLNHIFTEIESNVRFWKLYFMVMSQPDILAKYQGDIMNAITPLLVKVSAYFKKRGMADPELETRLLFSLLDGICMNYMVDTKHYPLDRIREEVLKRYGQ